MRMKNIVCVAALSATLLSSAAAMAAEPGPAKLDTRLAAIAQLATARQSAPLMARALTRQLFRHNSPLNVRWNAAGAVQVYMHFDKYRSEPSLDDLSALGATDITVSRELGVVQAWVPAGKLGQIAALADVSRVTLPHYAVVRGRPPATASSRTGSVDTQGDQVLGAQQFRQVTGYTGQGIAVGVISDGDDHFASAQSTNDLPSTVWNDPKNASTFKNSGDEGTAMMEIVYDLAPGAQLGFCGPQTTVDFITCLNDFVSHFGNTNLVIVDDLGFPGVAMFTDGGFASAVANFSKTNPAVRLVTAAGNDAQGFWSGNWNPVTLPSATVNNGNPLIINGITYSQIQNFGTSAAPVTRLATTIQPGDTLNWNVQWGDTWVPSDKVTSSTPNDPNNYDVILTDGSGNVLVCNIGMNFGTAASPPSPSSCPYTAAAGPTNTPGPQPIQGNLWQNTGQAAATVYLEVLYAPGDGTPDTHLKVLINNTEVGQYQIRLQPSTTAGSIYGQAALAYPYEITAGAVAAQNNPGFQIESYSSQGPVFLYQPATGSSTRMKPDFVGVDCVATTGAGGFPQPFCGTSAAAPHIAGLIALFESGYPSANPYTMLKNGAMALGSGSPNGVYGYGLPNAMRSAASQYSAPVATISSPGNGATEAPKQAVNFSGKCNANGAPGTLTYDWNFGTSSGIPDASVPNPSVTFASDGQYTVTLTCTNAFGTTGSTSTNLTVGSSNSAGSKSGGGSEGLLALALLGLLEACLLRRHVTQAITLGRPIE